MLASTEADYSFRLWDIDTCTCIQVLDTERFVHDIVFTPLDRFVLVFSTGHVTILKCPSGNIVAEIQVHDMDKRGRCGIVALSDEEFMKVDFGGELRVYRLDVVIEDPRRSRHIVLKSRFQAHEVLSDSPRSCSMPSNDY